MKRKLHPVLQRMLNEYRIKHANDVITQQQILNEINWFNTMNLTDKLYGVGLITFDEYASLFELSKKSFNPLFQELYCTTSRIKKHK